MKPQSPLCSVCLPVGLSIFICSLIQKARPFYLRLSVLFYCLFMSFCPSVYLLVPFNFFSSNFHFASFFFNGYGQFSLNHCSSAQLPLSSFYFTALCYFFSLNCNWGSSSSRRVSTDDNNHDFARILCLQRKHIFPSQL